MSGLRPLLAGDRAAAQVPENGAPMAWLRRLRVPACLARCSPSGGKSKPKGAARCTLTSWYGWCASICKPSARCFLSWSTGQKSCSAGCASSCAGLSQALRPWFKLQLKHLLDFSDMPKKMRQKFLSARWLGVCPSTMAAQILTCCESCLSGPKSRKQSFRLLPTTSGDDLILLRR